MLNRTIETRTVHADTREPGMYVRHVCLIHSSIYRMPEQILRELFILCCESFISTCSEV